MIMVKVGVELAPQMRPKTQVEGNAGHPDTLPPGKSGFAVRSLGNLAHP